MLRHRRGVKLTVVLALASGSLAAVPGALASGDTPKTAHVASVDPEVVTTGSFTDKVIVQATGGNVAKAAATVANLGGQVTRNLSIIDGFSALVPAKAVGTLARSGSIRTISADQTAMASSMTTSTPSTNNLPSVYGRVVGAPSLQAAGGSGSGVTVALVDTGVADSLDDLASRIVKPIDNGPLQGLLACANFTSEDCSDTYGHGTFIAGLIAGTGADSSGQYTGVAPSAKILSVKVAGRDGSTDVSNVIAAIQWVVTHKDDPSRPPIKVLNLSLGTDSAQSYKIDPFDYAVEQAWKAGIVVIVSASNLGPASGTITKPGDDPFVITVGAIDDKGTVGLSDDALPNFSARGPTKGDGLAKPDVAAPGAHLPSLAAPGSSLTTRFPPSMTPPYRRGSGTSMATGVVSGVVADMLSLPWHANTPPTPDRVKFALMATARPDVSTDRMSVGSGVINGYAAWVRQPVQTANQGVAPSDGTGPLDASRGSVVVQTVDQVPIPIRGNLTGQLHLFDLADYLLTWNSLNWAASQWAGSNWQGSNWQGSNWQGSNWQGSNWQGSPDSTSWYGSNWQGSAFYGAWDQ